MQESFLSNKAPLLIVIVLYAIGKPPQFQVRDRQRLLNNWVLDGPNFHLTAPTCYEHCSVSNIHMRSKGGKPTTT